MLERYLIVPLDGDEEVVSSLSPEHLRDLYHQDIDIYRFGLAFWAPGLLALTVELAVAVCKDYADTDVFEIDWQVIECRGGKRAR